MANSHCVPRQGGERLPDYLKRLFNGKSSGVDKLLEEQNQQQKEVQKSKGICKRIKNMFISDDKLNRNEKGNDLDDFLSEELEFDRRARGKKKTHRENIDFSNPDNFQQLRENQENDTTSTPATTANRHESSSLLQPDLAPSTSASFPRHFLRSGNSPIFQFYVPLKYDLRQANSVFRSVREMAVETHPPWTYKDYGSEPWAEDITNRTIGKTVDKGYRTIGRAEDTTNHTTGRTEETAYRATFEHQNQLPKQDTPRPPKVEYTTNRTIGRAEDTTDRTIGRADDSAYRAIGGDEDTINRPIRRTEDTTNHTKGRAEETAYRATFEHRNQLPKQDTPRPPPKVEDSTNRTIGRTEYTTYGTIGRAEDTTNHTTGRTEETAYRATFEHRNQIPKQDTPRPPKVDINKQLEHPLVGSSRNDYVCYYHLNFDPGYDNSEINKRSASQAYKVNKGHSINIDTRQVTAEKTDFSDKHAFGDTKLESTHTIKNTAKKSKDEKDADRAFAKRFPNQKKQNTNMPILKENKFVSGDNTDAKQKMCFSAAENEIKEKTNDVFEKNGLVYPYASSLEQCMDRKLRTDKNLTENKVHSSHSETSHKHSIRNEESFINPALNNSKSDSKNRTENTEMETKNGEKWFDRDDEIKVNTKHNSKKTKAFFVSLCPLASYGNDQIEDVRTSLTKRFPNKEKQNTAAATLNEDNKTAEISFKPSKNSSQQDQDETGKQESTHYYTDNTDKPAEAKTYIDDNINQEKTDTHRRKAEAFFISFGPSTTDTKDLGEDLQVRFKNRFPNNGTEAEYGSVEHHNKIKTDNAIRKKKLEEIQTKVDSWMTNDTRLSHKPAQYGSVEHNNLIKKDNAMRKKKIESATTKVDSWKTEETDDNYLLPNMRQYKVALKPAQYGSVAHNNQTKQDNAMRKKKIGGITTTLDTWKTNETDKSYLHPNLRGYNVVKRSAEYGSIEHHNQIKRNNAMRKMRLGKIQTGLDTWNTPNPGSKYSLKRKDEWEPVLDPGKYGSVAHFHQIKSNNAERKKRLNKIQSNLDTWNAQNPGSKYSLQRKDEWEPVYDTGKYGSVAHYHQVKQTHVDNRHMIKAASTRLCTWQQKSKMNLLNAPKKKKIETTNPNMKSLKASLNSVRSKIDSGTNDLRQSTHSLSSWSRHMPAGRVGDDETEFGNYNNLPSRAKYEQERTELDYDTDLSYRNKHAQYINGHINEPNQPMLDSRYCRKPTGREVSELTNQDYDYSFPPRRRHIPPETSAVNGHYQQPRSRRATNGTSPVSEHYQPSWSKNEPQLSRSSPVSCRTARGNKSRLPVPKENPVSRYEQTLNGVLRQNQK